MAGVEKSLEQRDFVSHGQRQRGSERGVEPAAENGTDVAARQRNGVRHGAVKCVAGRQHFDLKNIHRRFEADFGCRNRFCGQAEMRVPRLFVRISVMGDSVPCLQMESELQAFAAGEWPGERSGINVCVAAGSSRLPDHQHHEQSAQRSSQHSGREQSVTIGEKSRHRKTRCRPTEAPA